MKKIHSYVGQHAPPNIFVACTGCRFSQQVIPRQESASVYQLAVDLNFQSSLLFLRTTAHVYSISIRDWRS